MRFGWKGPKNYHSRNTSIDRVPFPFPSLQPDNGCGLFFILSVPDLDHIPIIYHIFLSLHS